MSPTEREPARVELLLTILQRVEGAACKSRKRRSNPASEKKPAPPAASSDLDPTSIAKRPTNPRRMSIPWVVAGDGVAVAPSSTSRRFARFMAAWEIELANPDNGDVVADPLGRQLERDFASPVGDPRIRSKRAGRRSC